MLVLPAKAAESRRARRLENRHHDRGASQPLWLCIADGDQRLVGDALDEARSERVGGDTEGTHVILEGNALDDVRVRSARVNQGTAKRLEESARGIQATRAVLYDLARTAGHHVLVAFPAALRVEGWPEAVDRSFHLLEDEAVVVERA